MAPRRSAEAPPPTPSLVEKLKARRKAAAAERDAMQPLIDEAYEYAIPYRKSSARTGKGEKRVDRVYDQTAITSAFRFAGRLQQDLVPEGFFTLEPGPVVVAAAGATSRDVKQLRTQLAGIGDVVNAMFLDGEWDSAFHEMALDLSAGTGAMLMLEGRRERMARFVTAPIDELLLEGGAYGDVTGIFWDRKWTLRSIVEEWEDAERAFTPELTRQLKEKPETEVLLHQDVYFDARSNVPWVHVCWIDKTDVMVNRASSFTCPWITPRYFRVAGETYGRGVLQLALPTIKVLNKAQQFTLQAAAIALLGIYTTVDDGVFNPDLAEIAPGAFWKVARNGGVLGPSVQRFPDPRLDLSQIVLNDLRLGVQATMMDQSLPPDGAAVRSATEILERVKRLASDHVGAYGRLVREIIVPAVRRAIEIAYNKLLIPQRLDIDELLVKVRVVSPLAQAREAKRVEAIVQWLQMVLALAPTSADEIADIAKALKQIGAAMSVSPELIFDDDESAKRHEQKVAEAVAMNAGPAMLGNAVKGAFAPPAKGAG